MKPLRIGGLVVMQILLFVDQSTAAPTPKVAAKAAKDIGVVTCVSFSGLSTQNATGGHDDWQQTADGYGADIYTVHVKDRSSAMVDVTSSKTGPLSFPVIIADIEQEFVTFVGVEVRRPVLITIFSNNVGAYSRQRWNVYKGTPEINSYFATCTIAGALPKP